MPKKNSILLKICDLISKYSIYALVFLLPIFFLPWTSDILDFNKQMLLLFLVFISLFAWMLKVLILRELSVNLNKTNIIVGVLFIVYLFSTIFSLLPWRRSSLSSVQLGASRCIRYRRVGWLALILFASSIQYLMLFAHQTL